MKEQLYLLQNDLRRATAQLTLARQLYQNDSCHRNKVSIEIYQNIIDKLDNKIQELRESELKEPVYKTAFDWGHTTEERNKNIDEYNRGNK